jgi:ATPase subunit of ABC transporter with duplicated ATPase domains
LGEALFQYAVTTNASSPWTALEDLLAAPESAPTPIRESAAVLEQHLQSEAVRSTWEDVRLMRVQDQIDLTLYRDDGSRAGSVLEGGLSDGQRNTAALALLLAQGNDPIVIDQPEDELDSNFIYRDLVPMLRTRKEGRQLIFATHNANLPVNGDAELIYALESQGGRGRPLAQGGLDLARVSDAVLDVMEGSREAFQKRREKYHF